MGVVPKTCGWLAKKKADKQSKVDEICDEDTPVEGFGYLGAWDVYVITCSRCTVVPTPRPSLAPSFSPSTMPSYKPSISPTNIPSVMPSLNPSFSPLVSPSSDPTIVWDCKEDSDTKFLWRKK